MQVGEAFVKVRPDTSGFGDDLASEVEGAGQRASTSLNQVLGAAAYGALLNQGIQAASELEQAVGGTSAVFQENAGIVDQWAANSVDAVGLSERAYRELASVIGGQLKGAGLSIDEATSATGDLVRIGADLAATFGGSTEEAVSALGATLRGEYDPAERFGLALTAVRVQAKAAELGLADATGAISSQARAQATLALINEQTADAQGQFAREADTAAGAAARAAAEAENQAAAFGDQLLPAYSAVLGVGAQVAGMFGSLPDPIQTGIIALGGFAALRGPVGGALGGIGDAVGGLTSRFREAGGGAAGLKAAITPGALGATAAVAGLVLITNELSNQAQRAAETRQAIIELGDAYAESGARGASESILQRLREESPEVIESLREAGVSVRDFVDAFLEVDDKGGAENLERLRAVLDDLPNDQALALVFALRTLREGIEQTADAEGQLEGSTDSTTASLDDQVASMEAIADAADEARDKLDALFGIQQTADEAAINLQEAYDTLNESIRENGRTFDEATPKGRENLQNARDAAAAIREQTIANVANGQSAREAARGQDFLLEGLRRTLRQAGLSAAETEELIRTYGRVPRRVLTDLLSNDRPARRGVDNAVGYALANWAGRVFEAYLHVGSNIGEVAAELDRMLDKANAGNAGNSAPRTGDSYTAPRVGNGGGRAGGGPTVVINAPPLTSDLIRRVIVPQVVTELDRIERRRGY